MLLKKDLICHMCTHIKYWVEYTGEGLRSFINKVKTTYLSMFKAEVMLALSLKTKRKKKIKTKQSEKKRKEKKKMYS